MDETADYAQRSPQSITFLTCLNQRHPPPDRRQNRRQWIQGERDWEVDDAQWMHEQDVVYDQDFVGEEFDG